MAISYNDFERVADTKINLQGLLDERMFGWATDTNEIIVKKVGGSTTAIADGNEYFIKDGILLSENNNNLGIKNGQNSKILIGSTLKSWGTGNSAIQVGDDSVISMFASEAATAYGFLTNGAYRDFTVFKNGADAEYACFLGVDDITTGFEVAYSDISTANSTISFDTYYDFDKDNVLFNPENSFSIYNSSGNEFFQATNQGVCFGSTKDNDSFDIEFFMNGYTQTGNNTPVYDDTVKIYIDQFVDMSGEGSPIIEGDFYMIEVNYTGEDNLGDPISGTGYIPLVTRFVA